MSVPAAGMESTTASKRATVTQEEQRMVEDQVFRSYYNFSTLPPNSQSVWLELQRDNHIEYLTNGLRLLNSSFVVLDANRPWLCYWILHSIALLGESVDPELEHNAIDFLSRCQDKDGGYGGGPGQMPHLATTYAAVNSLITLGGQNSLSSINRDKIYSFLQRMKQKSGGFSMHDGGEVDVRACYTAISVASALNILDNYLTENVGNYILSCQTYEGGISGEPGSEAHGGYTFCGLATMILINATYRLDLASLTDWIVFRQGAEGGFQGRTNKLVDGCYSFWQGGAAVLLQKLHAIAGEGHCSSGSTESSEASDLSEDEHCLEGASSDVGESCRNREEDIRFYKAHNKFLSDFFALLSILKTSDFTKLITRQQNASDQVNSSNFGSKRGYTKPGPLFQSVALQQYIILISQMEGGFRDKPGKGRDHYHTCYCLSGLSSSQYCWSENANSPPIPSAVLGPYSNLLEPINPLYNIVAERYKEASEFFASNF